MRARLQVTSILMQRLVEVDGKVRTDKTYPVGFMDVIDIPKTGEHSRAQHGRSMHRLGGPFGAFIWCMQNRGEEGG